MFSQVLFSARRDISGNVTWSRSGDKVSCSGRVWCSSLWVMVVLSFLNFSLLLISVLNMALVGWGTSAIVRHDDPKLPFTAQIAATIRIGFERWRFTRDLQPFWYARQTNLSLESEWPSGLRIAESQPYNSILPHRQNGPSYSEAALVCCSVFRLLNHHCSPSTVKIPNLGSDFMIYLGHPLPVWSSFCVFTLICDCYSLQTEF
jgi:hypothetical protein